MNDLKLTACLKLRTKSDYYSGTTSSEDDPDLGGGMPSVYWCLRTMQEIGPDDEPVTLKTCQPGRPCHVCSAEE